METDSENFDVVHFADVMCMVMLQKGLNNSIW